MNRTKYIERVSQTAFFSKNDESMDIAIYTLTSELHDEKAVGTVTKEYLDTLDIAYVYRESDYADYGSHALNLIFVRTGGTEGIFAQMLPRLLTEMTGTDSSQHVAVPFYLLTSGKSNSLAASMEILSYLQLQGLRGEIIHGPAAYVTKRLRLLEAVGEARRRLQGTRMGIVGKPSDWLIASCADKEAVRQRLGVDLIDIPMSDLLTAIDKADAAECQHTNSQDTKTTEACNCEQVAEAMTGANRIYGGLRNVIAYHHLQGFTIRCFDLLTAVKNTGCLALARLNSEGFVAGCEGDVPAMLTMMIGRSLLGVSGFQSNPAYIDTEAGEMLFAHCTIPLDMVERYELDTHFESGIGVAIRGYMKTGDVTILKVSGDLNRYFVAEGQLVRNESGQDLCRTQQRIVLDDARQAEYFLTNPIGNHHIIFPGHHKTLFDTFMRCL